jgi:hypothetical protein
MKEPRSEEDVMEEAEERFFIMSEQDDVGDITALKHIQVKYGRDIAIRIWKKYCRK